MEHTNRKRRKNSSISSESLDRARKRIRAEVSLSAGLSSFADLSPEVFAAKRYKAEFDAVGRAKAAEMTGVSGGNISRLKAGKAVAGAEDKSRADNDDSFCRKFVSYAFQGGKLAGAVLNGEAKTVFMTCVARSMTENEKQRRVKSSFARREDIDGTAVTAAFGDDIKSAVEITASAARGASEILDAFAKLARGIKTSRGESVETIALLYPFLSTDGEKALIQQCRNRLKTIGNDNSCDKLREKQSLEYTLNRTTAVLEGKNARRRDFLTKITEMQKNADTAEKMFFSDDFANTVAEEIERSDTNAPPDDDKNNRGTKGKGNINDEKANESEPSQAVIEAGKREKIE